METNTPQGPAEYTVTFTYPGGFPSAHVAVAAHSAVHAVQQVLRDHGDGIRITRVLVPVADLASLVRDARVTA